MADDRRQQPDRRLAPRVGGRRATDVQAEWVSISAFAKRFGIDRGTVYKWLALGLLEIYKVESLTRVRNLPPDQHQPQKSILPSVDPC